MFRPKKFLSYLKNKHRSWLTLMAMVTPALLLAATNASAASGAAAERKGPVRLLFTVPVPVAATNTTGGMYGFDISFVDQSNQTYYLGDRSNAAVDVVDASTGTFVKQITASPPFAGVQLNAAGTAVNNSISGPNGVATDGSGTCLFAGDGPSRVVSFKLPGGTQVGDVNTGGTTRADEMAFDPKDRLLLVVNNAETPPFATLISVGTDCTLTLGNKIVFDFATNGAEQPAWDPGTQRFYLSIPSISGTIAAPGTTGAVARINPLTASIETQFAVPFCGPAGLAFNPTNETFLVGCNTVYDTTGAPWSGTSANTANPVQVVIDVNGVFAFVTGIGSSDEVWYNAGDNHWYTGSSGSPYAPSVVVSGATAVEQGAAILGVIDGTSQILDQIVPTFNVPNVPPLLGPPPGHPSGTSHSVAANASNNWVFVPLPANNAIQGCLTGCIGVYGRNDADLVGAND